MDQQENDSTQNSGKNRNVVGPPLSEERVATVFNSDAKGAVPKNLRGIEQADLAAYEVKGVTRSEVAKETKKKAHVEPMRPAWVASAAAPKRAPVPLTPRKIEHRGQLLDPLLVFLPDDRRTYNDRSYPWGTVCKVITSMGMGSGAIVGPRHVLTASHIIDWSRNGAGSVEVHRVGGAVAATTAIITVWFYTKVTGSIGSSEVDEDYAVLVTSSRIGDRFGWMGTRTYDSGWDGESYWHSIGYSTDIGGANSPVWQRRRWLDEDMWDFGGGRTMTTNADVKPGQSGSPTFAFWSDGPYVVAVVSSQSSTENWCSGGNDMTRLVIHAIAQDP